MSAQAKMYKKKKDCEEDQSSMVTMLDQRGFLILYRGELRAFTPTEVYTPVNYPEKLRLDFSTR